MGVEVAEDFDVFISYASASNELPAPFDNWIAHFVDALRRMLRAQLGGVAPRVYFDLRTIEANQPLSEILDAGRKSRIFLAITSPAYHTRPWPQQELQAFVAARANPLDVFVAEMLPTRDELQLPALRERHRIAFHRMPSATSAREPVPLLPGTEVFYERVADLCASLLGRLRPMDRYVTERLNPVPALVAEVAAPILLCPVLDDLGEIHASVQRYLGQYCPQLISLSRHSIVSDVSPDACIPQWGDAKVVVQLLGAEPDVHANRLVEAARAAGKQILRWRPMDLQLNRLANSDHRNLLLGDDVIASTLEQFKGEVVRAWKRPKQAKATRPEFLVFVNAERSDRPIARRMRDLLASRCSVVLPLDDVAGSIQEDFNQNLRDCDALVLVYGEAGVHWVRSQLRQMRKARLGQGVPVGAICYGPPPDKPGVEFSVPGIDEIDCRSAAGDDWNFEAICQLLDHHLP